MQGTIKNVPQNHGKTLLNDGVWRMKMTQNPLRVVLKILDLSFLPILVFSVSAAFRLFRCHFVKSHQSHSPLCSFFNLQKHTQKKSENQLDIIFRTTLKGNSKSKTHNSLLTAHYSSLIAHRSLSNIFTFVHKTHIGFKMNKNRLK